MSDQQNPDNSRDRKGKGKVTDPAELARLDRERHLEEEEARQRRSRQSPIPYDPLLSHVLEEEEARNRLSRTNDEAGFRNSREDVPTGGEDEVAPSSLVTRRETYLQRANNLRTLIYQQHNSLLAEIDRYYPLGASNNLTITRKKITIRASQLMVMRQHWNEAVLWYRGQGSPFGGSNPQSRIERIEQSLRAAEIIAEELPRGTGESAPVEHPNGDSIMHEIGLDIPAEFLNQKQQQQLKDEEQSRKREGRISEWLQGIQQHDDPSQLQQHPSGQEQQQQQPESSRQQQQPQQQRGSSPQQHRQQQPQPQPQQEQEQILLQLGLDTQQQELSRGTSAGQSLDYFAIPGFHTPEPTAEVQGPTTGEQEQGTGEDGHDTGEQSLGPREQQHGTED